MIVQEGVALLNLLSGGLLLYSLPVGDLTGWP